MRWKENILIALIFFGVGFIVGWYPTVESVRNFIIGGISLGLVVEVVGILREIFKERREEHAKEHEKLKSYIHEHNKKLIDTVVKTWYEDKFVSVEYKPYTIEHLQTGYTILKTQQEYKALIHKISSEENAIKEYIKNKLAPVVPPFGFSVKEGFTVEEIEAQIYKTIENFSRKGGVPDNYIANLSLFGYRVEDHNEKYLVDKKEAFRRGIEAIIKDKILYEMFERITKNRESSNEKIHAFHQGLKQIEHDFERHIELKGTCKDCKDWHDELKSLK